MGWSFMDSLFLGGMLHWNFFTKRPAGSILFSRVANFKKICGCLSIARRN
jgi:hypothetical protein